MWGQSLGNFPHLWQKYEYCVPHLKATPTVAKVLEFSTLGTFNGNGPRN